MKNNKHKSRKQNQASGNKTQSMVLKLTRENLFESGIVKIMQPSIYYKGIFPEKTATIQACISREHPDGTMSFMLCAINALTGALDGAMIEFGLERELFDGMLKSFKLEPYADKKALERLIYDAHNIHGQLGLSYPEEFLPGMYILQFSRQEALQAATIAQFQRVPPQNGQADGPSTAALSTEPKFNALSVYNEDKALIYSNVPLPQGVLDAIMKGVENGELRHVKSSDLPVVSKDPHTKSATKNEADLMADAPAVQDNAPTHPPFDEPKGGHKGSHKGTVITNAGFENEGTTNKGKGKQRGSANNLENKQQDRGNPPNLSLGTKNNTRSGQTKMESLTTGQNTGKVLQNAPCQIEAQDNFYNDPDDPLGMEQSKKDLQQNLNFLQPYKCPLYDPGYCKDWDQNQWMDFIKQPFSLEDLAALKEPALFHPLLYLMENAMTMTMQTDSVIMEALQYLESHPVMTTEFPDFGSDYVPSPTELKLQLNLKDQFYATTDLSKRRAICEELENMIESYPHNSLLSEELLLFYRKMDDDAKIFEYVCKLYRSSKDRERAVCNYFIEINKQKKSTQLDEFLKQSFLFEKHLPDSIILFNTHNYHQYYQVLASYLAENNHWVELLKLIKIFLAMSTTKKDDLLLSIWNALYIHAVDFMHMALYYMSNKPNIQQQLIQMVLNKQKN